MADAKKCDRCGEFYIQKDNKFKIDDEFPVELHLTSRSGWNIKEYDLCDKCWEELMDFLDNCSDTVINRVKKEYEDSEVIMSEYLRSCPYNLTVEEKRYLINWAGEEDFVEVLDNGKIVVRELL